MVKTKLLDWDPVYRKPFVKDFKKSVSVKAFIQAREDSTRLPGKIYKDINGAPMLWHVIDKAKQCRLLDDVIIISPKILPELPEDIKDFVWVGPQEDVLSRYWHALQKFPCDYVVRLTSDCPLLDPNLIDCVISESIGHDYGTNVLPCTFPNGLDVEVISTRTLNNLNTLAKSNSDREHVTTYIRDSPAVQAEIDVISIQSMKDYSYIKVSVDTEEDLEYVRKVEKELCQIK